jgi:hypothetical protein
MLYILKNRHVAQDERYVKALSGQINKILARL